MPLPRREFLARCGIGALALSGRSARAAEPTSRTRLILLGTAGGPTPKRLRAAPAQVILVGDDAYVVDCGDGVARQMALAGVPLERMRGVFITHQHSDHNAGYGSLLLFAWMAGLKPGLDTYGPPPLVHMTDLVAELHAYDIETRVRDEGRAPFTGLVNAHEITAAGLVMERGGVKVTAALVDHPPVRPAFAYRFDTPDRSIVFSGDTAPSESLVALARGADVLVHEALYAPAIDRLVENEPHALRLRQHLMASHTPTSEVGRIAAAAGVKTLVLTHFVPGDDASITDEMWTEGVRARFKGTVVVGKDLMIL